MLSSTCKIGIKAVLYLAQQLGKEEKKSIHEIAENIQASEDTVKQLLQTLAKKKVIKTSTDAVNEFYITPEQCQKPIINIVKAIEEGKMFSECGLGLQKCSALKPCPIHFVFNEAKGLFENLLREKKIIQMCQSLSSGNTFLIG